MSRDDLNPAVKCFPSDSGLNCVYVVCEKGSSATMFGSQGQALQLRRPNSLVVDEAGNMIVADDGKMQVVSNDQEFLGVVKVGEILIYLFCYILSCRWISR